MDGRSSLSEKLRPEGGAPTKTQPRRAATSWGCVPAANAGASQPCSSSALHQPQSTTALLPWERALAAFSLLAIRTRHPEKYLVKFACRYGGCIQAYEQVLGCDPFQEQGHTFIGLQPVGKDRFNTSPSHLQSFEFDIALNVR